MQAFFWIIKRERKSDNYWRKIKGSTESQGWQKRDFILDWASRAGLTDRVASEWMPGKTKGANQGDTWRKCSRQRRQQVQKP